MALFHQQQDFMFFLKSTKKNMPIVAVHEYANSTSAHDTVWSTDSALCECPSPLGNMLMSEVKAEGKIEKSQVESQTEEIERKEK